MMMTVKMTVCALTNMSFSDHNVDAFLSGDCC